MLRDIESAINNEPWRKCFASKRTYRSVNQMKLSDLTTTGMEQRLRADHPLLNVCWKYNMIFESVNGLNTWQNQCGATDKKWKSLLSLTGFEVYPKENDWFAGCRKLISGSLTVGSRPIETKEQLRYACYYRFLWWWTFLRINIIKESSWKFFESKIHLNTIYAMQLLDDDLQFMFFLLFLFNFKS